MKALWAHQEEAIERARGGDYFGLFFQPGCGKSRTVIEILREKYRKEKRLLRTIIFAPGIVLSNWRDEWLKFSKLTEENVIPLIGSGKRRLSTFEEFAWEAGKPVGRIFLANYESLLMEPLYIALERWLPEVLVLDESHKCKAWQSKRTKQSLKLSRLPKYKYLLSGTPVLNSPLDLFPQYLIMDGGTTFGSNYYAFKNKYFIDRNARMPAHKYFPKLELTPTALTEINQKIASTSMRVEKEDCLDLPPLIRQVIKVQMAPQQSRLYEEMKKDFITFLGQEAVVATLAITKALRLMQIASGFVKEVEGREIVLEDSPKLAALEEILEEIAPHHKVLVWATWKANYREIATLCQKLKLEYVEVHGDISESQKTDNVHRFQTDPKCRVFIGNPAAGGIGINLVQASYAIFFSRNFSLENDLQAEARNHRGGSLEQGHQKITRIDLVTAGTIDELIAEKLANKLLMSDKILTDLSVYLRGEKHGDREFG